VGDRGRLVVPLGSAFAGTEDRVLQKPEELPRSEDLVITRVELDRRETAARLIVDFQAYVPGLIEFPSIEIGSYSFPGLQAPISSILSVERRGMVLSAPADPLAAPGTAVMIYGTVLGIILCLLGITLGSFWGKRMLRDFWERLRRRQLIRAMGRSLRRLRNGGAGGEAETLLRLSADFRIFLSVLTGTNCRAMVPREFLSLPPLGPGALLSGASIADLFRRCDTLRFSGAGIEQAAVSAILDDFRTMISALDAAERAKPLPGQVPEDPAERLSEGVS
jgi:hypothetical protein